MVKKHELLKIILKQQTEIDDTGIDKMRLMDKGDEHLAGRLGLRVTPPLDITTDAVIAAFISYELEFLKKLLRRPTLALGKLFVIFKLISQLFNKGPQLGHGLFLTFVCKRRLLTADHLPDCIS